MDEKEKNKLVKELKNHKLTLDDIADMFNTDKTDAEQRIDELSQQHIDIDVSKSPRSSRVYYNIKLMPDSGNIYEISKHDKRERRGTFAACSDLHFASKFHLPKTFDETMKRLVDEGVKKVYVAGDIVDGRNIYKGHLENLIAHTVESQTDMAAEAFSKHPMLEFWAVAGNHDYSFTKQNGVKPLAILEQKADNFKNLGDFRADVIYNGIRMRLLHGGTGRTYARSYPSQTYLRDYFGGMEKEEIKHTPHIIMLGHFHTLYVGKDHGIWIVQSGSFQDGDNEYCLRRGLTGPNGAFKVDMKYKNAEIYEFQTKYIQPAVRKKEKGKAFSKTTVNY